MAAGLLVSGCGTERPDAATAADASFSPAPTPTTSTPSPAATGALEGFPLDLGYDDENGDDHSPVVVTGKPAMAAFKNCDETAWDPHQGTTDVIGVEFRGEAEWARGTDPGALPDGGRRHQRRGRRPRVHHGLPRGGDRRRLRPRDDDL